MKRRRKRASRLASLKIVHYYKLFITELCVCVSIPMALCPQSGTSLESGSRVMPSPLLSYR